MWKPAHIWPSINDVCEVSYPELTSHYVSLCPALGRIQTHDDDVSL